MQTFNFNHKGWESSKANQQDDGQYIFNRLDWKQEELSSFVILCLTIIDEYIAYKNRTIIFKFKNRNKIIRLHK